MISILTNANHVQHDRDCLNITEKDRLSAQLKTENNSKLVKCPAYETLDDSSLSLNWGPVIGSNHTKDMHMNQNSRRNLQQSG